VTLSTTQELPNRVNSSGGVTTRGSSSGTDANDPIFPNHTGTHYIYLPGTTGNHLSVPKDGGWAATIHITATKTDDTTETFTTTASPILIGDTDLTEDSYKKVELRDTNDAGTLRLTIEPTNDINTTTDRNTGQTTFTSEGTTITIARTTSALTTTLVTRPGAILNGTSHYLQLPTDATPTITRTTGQFTALVLLRKNYDGAAFDRYISWESASGVDGMYIGRDASNRPATYIGDNASTKNSINTADGISIPLNELVTIGAVINNGTIATYLYGEGLNTSPTDITTLASDPTFTTGRIGTRAYNVSNTAGIEVFDFATFQDQALTEDQLDTFSDKLIAGTYT